MWDVRDRSRRTTLVLAGIEAKMIEVETTRRNAEEGFLLVGAIVMIALVLIFLSIAAPVVAKDLRREKELEAVHRGREYTHAVRMFYKKFNTYPASMEALEKTNNIRYLRKRYIDPLTGKDDWRVIPAGQAKTTVKGFFGEPLAGLATSGLGSAAGSASAQQPGGGIGGPAGQGLAGQSGTSGVAGGTGTNGTGAGGSGTTGAGTDSGFGTSSFGSNSSGSSSSSNPLSGGSGPFVGVGIKKDGASILTLNEQTDYSTWEFIYDPRIEQLLAKVSLFGGGIASQSSGSLGSASGLSGTNSTNGFGGTNGQGTTNPIGNGSTSPGSGASPAPTQGVPVQQ